MVTIPKRSVRTIGSLETASCRVRIFSIQYRPGIKNSLADACSRVTSQWGDANECDDATPTFIMETDEMEYEYDEGCYTVNTANNHPITLPKAIDLEEVF
jgi:hypothetical protein